MMHNKEKGLSIVDLANGERIGMAAVEITTVPHSCILQKQFANDVNFDAKYKQEMARLLSGVFQNYKNASSGCKDISLEILWTTQEVKNQTYKASITLHLVIRAIGNNDADIESEIQSLMQTCKSTLSAGKYDYKNADINELLSRVRNINGQSVKAIVKNERLENLQNNLLPFCFVFERIPTTENDLSGIVNSLIM